MSRRSLGTIRSVVLLAALSGIVAGCGGDHSSGTGGEGGSGSSAPGDVSSAYLASSGSDFAGDYTVATDNGNTDNGNTNSSDDGGGGNTDVTIADNGNVSGTAPDSDGGTDDLSGIVGSGGDADIDTTGVSRSVHSVGVLKRVAAGVLMGTMTETVRVAGAAPVTRVVVYRFTKRPARVSSIAAL